MRRMLFHGTKNILSIVYTPFGTIYYPWYGFFLCEWGSMGAQGAAAGIYLQPKQRRRAYPQHCVHSLWHTTHTSWFMWPVTPQICSSVQK